MLIMMRMIMIMVVGCTLSTAYRFDDDVYLMTSIISRWLQSNENVEAICLDFTVSYEGCGHMITHELKPGFKHNRLWCS